MNKLILTAFIVTTLSSAAMFSGDYTNNMSNEKNQRLYGIHQNFSRYTADTGGLYGFHH